MTEKIDVSYIKSLSEGDSEFEKRILNVLKGEFPVEVEEYQSALGKNNFKKAADLVHKIKHKISILGLKKSYSLAQQYEVALKNEDMGLADEFGSVLSFISEYIRKI